MQTPMTRYEHYLAVLGGGDYPLFPPKIREEYYLAKLAEMDIEIPQPITEREHIYYKLINDIPIAPRNRWETFAAAANDDSITAPIPITREEAFWSDVALVKEVVETYTGALPVTLEGTVTGSLVTYKIWGNTGGVGVKKANLAEGEQLLEHAAMGSDGHIVSSSQDIAFRLVPVVEGREYTIINIYGGETSTASNFYAFFEEMPQIGSVSYNDRRYSFKTPSKTFVAPINGYLATSDYYPMYDEQHSNLIPLEVYEGNESPYYLPIVSASETTNIYIGRTALEKGEYVNSESGKIYKWADITGLSEPYLTPTDPPVPLPEIPTFAPTTTISYGGGTGAQPEKVEFKYKVRKKVYISADDKTYQDPNGQLLGG